MSVRWSRSGVAEGEYGEYIGVSAQVLVEMATQECGNGQW